MTEKTPLRTALDIANEKGLSPNAETAAPDTALIPAQRTSPDSPLSPDAPLVTGDHADTDDVDPFATPDHNASPDDADIYTHLEILGRRYPVQRMTRWVKSQSEHIPAALEMRSNNGLERFTTRAALRARRAWARSRSRHYDKKLAAVSKLDDSSMLKQHRTTQQERAEDRTKAAEKAFDDNMRDRRTRIDDVANTHAETIRKNQADLRTRREEALGRKVLRGNLREQGASRREVRAMLEGVSLERIGKIAATAYVSERRSAGAQQDLQTAISKERATQSDITTNRERARNAGIAQARAERRAAEYRTSIEKATNETLPDLQHQLEASTNDSDEYRLLALQIQDTEDDIRRYTREAEYWEQETESMRRRVEKLETKHTSLVSEAKTRETARSAAEQAAELRRAAAEQHTEERNTTAESITGSQTK